MSDCPHLVFVKGPQAGQRVSLHGDRIVSGRSSDCQLPLKEHYVSRQQMQFTRSPDGWILENLSSNGTGVNGRRYKADKQILLATGDLLSVGMETEILFVGEGDDPKEALAKYRESLPAAEPSPLPAEPVPAPVPDQPAEGELPPPPEDNPEPATESIASLSEEQIQSQERKARMKKYVVLLGISVAITVGVIALGSFVKKPVKVVSGAPARLTGDEIQDAIMAVPENLTTDATQATNELQLATLFFKNHFLDGQLYICIWHYKLYQAYRGGKGFQDPTGRDEHNYRTALNGDGQLDLGLIGTVRAKYDLACQYEQAQRWEDALPLLDDLVKMIPATPDDPTYDKLLVNIKAHRQFVQLKMPKKS